MTADIEALKGLLARVKSATDESRELDAEIDAALFGGRASHTYSRDTAAGRLRSSYGAGTVFDPADESANGGFVLISMTRHSMLVTGSTDAALALVARRLPGWRVKALGEGPAEDPRSRNFQYDGTWFAHLHAPVPGMLYNLAFGAAPTPALALVAALLAALVAEKEAATEGVGGVE